MGDDMRANAPFDIAAFLAEPLRPAQVASVGLSGAPVLGSFWFLFGQGRFWFSSRPETPIPGAVARGADVAIIVDEFAPPQRIRQVRVRGPGRLQAHDPDQVQRIYCRYLGADLEDWPPTFRARVMDPDWALWTVTPTSGLVAAYPNFDTRELRWRHPKDSPLPQA